MSINLNELVDSLIQSAPPAELKQVSQSLSSLTKGTSTSSTNSLIQDSIEQYAQENIISIDNIIISKYNKDENSSKYIDYVNNKLFNVDWQNQKIIDVESYHDNNNKRGSNYDELIQKLSQYGDDYYPSNFAFTVIPESEDQLRVIIIGQRANHDNFYTGQWKSNYLITEQGIKGNIDLDIHYFEDGNVRLKFNESINSSNNNNNSSTLQSGNLINNASKIVNFINEQENATMVKIIEQFNNLNQKSFKNLRRLLPVTRSKINWGSAIGNYRLGSDVVNKK
ncbi:F-actin-capping protein subunit alpha [Candida albicans P87]|nr:F-actin-capping protein subunit alpha [Candida albicans GC75]KGU01961.1 F-actin-capping protein subunit alpha [Candida albicans P87]KGU19999.1 F-actin-capping protein subunit alpha [Candida albicans P34048]KGU23720.1 F-actin-capping protein subunit alpha [Candida albicans P75063]KHC30753.1 F-actin-capping protein subunit alpha [Candida albicans Ca6]KHC61154.1 F-actin-capping protein subunit alpha [Candida albicans P75016]